MLVSQLLGSDHGGSGAVNFRQPISFWLSFFSPPGKASRGLQAKSGLDSRELQTLSAEALHERAGADSAHETGTIKPTAPGVYCQEFRGTASLETLSRKRPCERGLPGREH